MNDKNEKVDILEEDPKVEKKDKKTSKIEAEVETLKEENEKLFKEKDELNTKYLLAIADSRNYKKRLDDEQAKFYKYSTYSISEELVKLLDSFDLAIEKDSENDAIKAYLEGFKMIRSSLYSILEKEGIKEIDALGKEFDPNQMEAVQQVCDESKKDQEVVKVFLKGYMYKDRLLRAAHVVINSLPIEETENKEINENK